MIGDEHEQAEHAAEMMCGGMMHDEPNAVAVGPSQIADLVYTFDEAGELLVGCHVDGHYETGMRGTVPVEE